MGAGDVRKAKESAYKGMYLGVVVSVYASGILLTISTYLVQWLTPDPTLQRLIFDLLPLIAFGQVSMSVGMVCWNILGAQGRVRVATLIEFAVSWLIVMPMAAILVYVYNFNLSGMVGPLDVGYTLGGVTITYLLITSDWQGLSREVISRNGGNISYDEVSIKEGPRACMRYS
jgi:Na+-driven multidrug efflux pump